MGVTRGDVDEVERGQRAIDELFGCAFEVLGLFFDEEGEERGVFGCG
jgi:hypothetical protein